MYPHVIELIHNQNSGKSYSVTANVQHVHALLKSHHISDEQLMHASSHSPKNASSATEQRMDVPRYEKDAKALESLHQVLKGLEDEFQGLKQYGFF